MGVRRAVELVLDADKDHHPPVYTFGPLIHNPQVLELLKEKGITILTEIPEKGSGTVIVRAHGVPPDIIGRLNTAGFTVVNATCPRVIKVQNIIKTYAARGFSVIIVGDENHPEVIGLHGFSGDRGFVVGSLVDLKQLPFFNNAIIVAQTTQNTSYYDEIKSWVKVNCPHYKIFDTICDSTEKRQWEVKDMATKSDALVIVGGKNSGNTQRLYEIALQSGKPAFHIETATELDLKSLAKANTIGITAGASTPNWSIKRVYRTLETIPYQMNNNWRGTLLRLQQVLLLTSLYVAVGAGCLGYACAKLQKLNASFSALFISFFYILSMHILNNFSGKLAGKYNAPDKVQFYEQYRGLLVLIAVLSTILGLFFASSAGLIPMILFLLMTISGLLYNTDVIPTSFFNFPLRKIKDIPASKTLLTSLGWGVVTSVFPALTSNRGLSASTAFVFFWATSLVFVRTAFFDILDIQGDRIVGRETIPILIGERPTLKLLKTALIVLSLFLVVLSLSGLISGLGILLVLCQLSLYAVIKLHEKGHMLPGTRLEFLVETHFVACGVISILWSLSV
jgi:4-hydroxy-3-methylbut-2-enyl diphosphate reductase